MEVVVVGITLTNDVWILVLIPFAAFGLAAKLRSDVQGGEPHSPAFGNTPRCQWKLCQCNWVSRPSALLSTPPTLRAVPHDTT